MQAKKFFILFYRSPESELNGFAELLRMPANDNREVDDFFNEAILELERKKELAPGHYRGWFENANGDRIGPQLRKQSFGIGGVSWQRSPGHWNSVDEIKENPNLDLS